MISDGGTSHVLNNINGNADTNNTEIAKDFKKKVNAPIRKIISDSKMEVVKSQDNLNSVNKN